MLRWMLSPSQGDAARIRANGNSTRVALVGTAAESGDARDMLTWSQSATAAGTIEYVSEPFADGALLAGPIAAQLHVSSSNKNIELNIEVLDRAPNGQSTRFTRGSILGTLRKTDPALSWKDDADLPKRPRLTLDEEQAVTPSEPTLLDDCLDPLGVPVGCYPTNPMLESLRGGSYALQHNSLISLPLVGHGAFASATSAVSPTAAVMASSPDARPLPIDW